jgi:CheY-like chemotaxis protein
LHRTYIADVERGARNVTLRSIVNLAAALEVTVGHLLSCATAPAGAGLEAGGADGEPAPTEILLVEDSAADAALTMRAFKRARFTNPLRIVCDAEEGLAYLFGHGRYAQRRPERPGLILLDLNLPGMSGLECLRRIKADARTREIPVAVLTVSKSDRMIVECGRLGAENYIVKPLSIESFLRVTPKLNLRLTLSALGNGGRRSLTL